MNIVYEVGHEEFRGRKVAMSQDKNNMDDNFSP